MENEKSNGMKQGRQMSVKLEMDMKRWEVKN